MIDKNSDCAISESRITDTIANNFNGPRILKEPAPSSFKY